MTQTLLGLAVLLILLRIGSVEWPRLMDALEDAEPDYEPPWASRP